LLDEWTREFSPEFSYGHGPRLFVVIGRQQVCVTFTRSHPYPARRHRGSRIARVGLGRYGNCREERRGADGPPARRRCRRDYVGRDAILLIDAGALHAHMHRDAALTYAPIQLANAKAVVRDELERPEDHTRVLCRVRFLTERGQVHGASRNADYVRKTTRTSYSDPEVQQVNGCAPCICIARCIHAYHERYRCLARLGRALTPGRYMVNTYPVLRYLPDYLRELRVWHAEELALFHGQAGNVRRKMVGSNRHRRPIARRSSPDCLFLGERRCRAVLRHISARTSTRLRPLRR
jgi:hypothetical protein